MSQSVRSAAGKQGLALRSNRAATGQEPQIEKHSGIRFTSAALSKVCTYLSNMIIKYIIPKCPMALSPRESKSIKMTFPRHGTHMAVWPRCLGNKFPHPWLLSRLVILNRERHNVLNRSLKSSGSPGKVVPSGK